MWRFLSHCRRVVANEVEAEKQSDVSWRQRLMKRFKLSLLVP